MCQVLKDRKVDLHMKSYFKPKTKKSFIYPFKDKDIKKYFFTTSTC